jgi:hypothetical protein
MKLILLTIIFCVIFSTNQSSDSCPANMIICHGYYRTVDKILVGPACVLKENCFNINNDPSVNTKIIQAKEVPC